MLKKQLKINETALAVIVLVVVAIPFFTFSYNKKIDKESLQKQQAKELADRAVAQDFLAKFEQQEDIQKRLGIVAEMHKASSLDRDIVDEYVYLLVTSGKNEQAYTIISKYFKETPKDAYWDDVELWIDYALASMNTKRCLEAIVGAWHITTKTSGESEQYKFAEAIMGSSLNKKDCID